METVLISGGSGLVGRRLTELLQSKGYEVNWLSRNSGNKNGITCYKWDIKAGELDKDALNGVDHIIHLAGASISDGRWTPSRKKELVNSRIDSTQLLYNALKDREHSVQSFTSASAIGFYGDRGDDVMTEESKAADDFLGDLCMRWEAEAAKISELGIRVSMLRIGIVLSTKGGALKEFILPSAFGLAPFFGSGKQYYSWIHIDDLCGMFAESISNPNFSGPVNAVAPNPLRLKDFAKAIPRSRGRISFGLPVPEFALRIGMGEMTDFLMASTRVSCTKALDAGYEFRFEELKPALQDLFRSGV